MTETIEHTINNLEKKVSSFIKSENKILNMNRYSNLISLNSPILLYIICPIVLLIIIIFIKPEFLKKDIIENNLTIDRRLDWIKILVLIVIISTIVNYLIYTKFLKKT
jgi:hypothetical protein